MVRDHDMVDGETDHKMVDGETDIIDILLFIISFSCVMGRIKRTQFSNNQVGDGRW